MKATRIHLVLMVAWTATILPTLLWWRNSILWVAFMSLYAIVVGHWGAYQAARAGDQAEEAAND